MTRADGSHGQPTARDLVPPGFDARGLSHYRVLLPLPDPEPEAFRPWSSFLPNGAQDLERLRTADLGDLLTLAADAGAEVTGWESARGQVSDEFVAQLGAALDEFVPADATWSVLRWRGHRHELPGATPVALSGLDYARQVLDLPTMLAGLRELGMPEHLWCSSGSFAWSAPLYPDHGVMTLAARHWIEHIAPRRVEAFAFTPEMVLPDNLGD